MAKHKSQRTPDTWALRATRQVVNLFGLDGAQAFIGLVEANKTPKQIIAEMRPFIERAAKLRKEVRANG